MIAKQALNLSALSQEFSILEKNASLLQLSLNATGETLKQTQADAKQQVSDQQ